MSNCNILRHNNLIVTPAVTEIHLAQAYIRMQEEDTLSTVFYQGVPTLQDFLAEYLTHGRRITLGCFRAIEGESKLEFCGLGWVFGAVTMDKYSRAETGMVFFKRQSSRLDNLTFGHMMLSSFFNNYKIDAIFGTTPEPNRLALRYAQKLGMQLIGPVPNYATWHGEMTAGWISHISRSQWLERKLVTGNFGE